MFIVPSSYGALSATSANTIQGHKPGFSGQSGAKKLGFKVGNITYSEANPVLGGSNTDKDKIVPGTPKEFEKTLKLSEFRVQGLTVSDFSVATDYYDADGDDAHPSTPFSVVGGVSHKWFDGNGAEITDENKMVGCSGLRQPLTLKINLVAQSHSKYGDPRDSDSAGLEQRYQIKAPTSGFCFAKPNSSDWWDSNGSGNRNRGNVTPHQYYGGGYNAEQFVPNYGFKASLSPAFPTTGFVGAEFTLMMIGNVNDYTFTHNGGTSITLNTTTGKVTLNSKPGGAVTITATKNGMPHYYTFNPALWVRPSGTSTGIYGWANGQCGGVSKIPSRLQLTSASFASYYTRAVGGGVFGEWGSATGGTSGTYPGSQWYSGNMVYWTREPNFTDRFVVHSTSGGVAWSAPSSYSYCVACLE
ncbi:hypothetical protein RCS94_08670 [Orbaceae bacterium ac157xtp]